MVSRLYITLFDKTRFKAIVDLTSYDKQATWSMLSNKRVATPKEIIDLLTDARRNRADSTEVWTFQSELEQDALWDIAYRQPKDFMEAIRIDGNSVYVSGEKEAV